MQHRTRVPLQLWTVAAVALTASLTMILIVFQNQGFVKNTGDPYDYGRIAHGFVEHGFDRLTRRSAMLYPHLLAVVYWLGGNDFIVQLIHCAFHTATCVLVFVIGRRVFNERTGLLAGLFSAVNPMFLRYVADLHTETMLVFMCTLTVWFAIGFDERPTVANGIWLGAVGMLAALTKGVVLPILVAYGAVWSIRSFWPGARRARPLPGVLAMFITMTIIVSPWTYRNYRVSGRFVLLTPGTPDAFLRGYIFTRLEFATLQKPPMTDAENESNALFLRIAREAGATWELDEVMDDDNNAVVAKRMIVEHPIETVRKVVVGLFTFWYQMTSFRNSLIPAVLALMNWILAFIGLRRALIERRPAWLLLLPIVVLNVFVATLVALGRYSVPILPCLAILAAFGADTLLDRRSVSRAHPEKGV